VSLLEIVTLSSTTSNVYALRYVPPKSIFSSPHAVANASAVSYVLTSIVEPPSKPSSDVIVTFEFELAITFDFTLSRDWEDGASCDYALPLC
jgi:hypothetical protein